jgi:hypothetical protein
MAMNYGKLGDTRIVNDTWMQFRALPKPSGGMPRLPPAPFQAIAEKVAH